MSAPNNTYDPVRVAALAPAEVDRMTREAVEAIAAAGTLDELRAASLAHLGRHAPLTLAGAEIGALPPQAAGSEPPSSASHRPRRPARPSWRPSGTPGCSWTRWPT